MTITLHIMIVILLLLLLLLLLLILIFNMILLTINDLTLEANHIQEGRVRDAGQGGVRVQRLDAYICRYVYINLSLSLYIYIYMYKHTL